MVGFYAGSFDPFTNGHLSIVRKASKSFDRVIVGIGNNDEKKRRVDKNAMLDVMRRVISDEGLYNVEVIAYDSITTRAARDMGANILIRGLRNGTDYAYEENIAALNEINSGYDTCYLRADSFGYLSSSLVMDLYKHGDDVSQYVPGPVNELLMNMRNNNNN